MIRNRKSQIRRQKWSYGKAHENEKETIGRKKKKKEWEAYDRRIMGRVERK